MHFVSARYLMAQEYRTPGKAPSGTREVGLVGFILPVVVLIVVVVVAVTYWAGRDPTTPEEEPEEHATSTSNEPKPGGFDPQPEFGSTREELEHRGATSRATAGTYDAITQIRQAASAEAGRRVSLTGEVADAPDADHFWLRDGKDRVEVVAPSGLRTLGVGERVTVTGVIELDRGTPRIRAERVATE
jgi:uncharacterized protein YdeI (BOF family)